MKKLVCLMLCLMMMACSVTAFASESGDITVTVDGEKLSFDVQPFIENDRTLVPMRGIFEALGCYVDYYEADGAEYVTARRADDYIMLTIGKNEIEINEETIELDVAPKIVNDRTFVPVRAVSEALGEDVDWVDSSSTVVINKRHGDHKVTAKNIRTSGDGYELCIYYPFFENKEQNEYIDEINAIYEASAKENAEYALEQLVDSAQDTPEDFGKLFYTETFKVDRDSTAKLSVTIYIDVYYGGAHPQYARCSQNYDLIKKAEITLAEALGMDEDDVENFVYESFKSYFDGDEIFDDYVEPLLKESAKRVNYRMNGIGVELYFNPYEIAPYSYGIPSLNFVTIEQPEPDYGELLNIVTSTEIGTAGSTQKVKGKIKEIAQWFDTYKPSIEDFDSTIKIVAIAASESMKNEILGKVEYLCEAYQNALEDWGYDEGLTENDFDNLAIFAMTAYELNDTKVVWPLEVSYSSDATYTAMITDMQADEISAKVYTDALYDAIDITGLNVGDAIVCSNGVIRVKSIEEGNNCIIINGGLENCGMDIISAGGGTFAEGLMDDDRAQICLGEYTYKIADDVTLVDSSDLTSQPKTVNGKADVTEYLSSAEYYGTMEITFENNIIKEIKIIYHP